MQIYISKSIGEETEFKHRFVLSIKNCNKYSADGVSPIFVYFMLRFYAFLRL